MEAFREFFKPELMWFLVGFAFFLLEFMLPGLICVFFAVGAWIVAIVCLVVPVSFNLQLVIFMVASILLLLVLRQKLKGVFLGHTRNAQELTETLKEFVGERAVVVEAITPQAGGKVELHGTRWSAFADRDIAEGASVEVTSKENLTLKVKPI
ncbi:MAG: NfeD family protein [Planctomycetes bacterium]|nr:NfeD family protein [Planctomycetota bacterium]